MSVSTITTISLVSAVPQIVTVYSTSGASSATGAAVSAGNASASISGSSGSSYPVGAIIGGILGGSFLAIAAVVGWILWGRSIKRKERKRRQELPACLVPLLPSLFNPKMNISLNILILPFDLTQIDALTVRENTRHNASTMFSTPRSVALDSHSRHPSESNDRTIRFAA